MSLLFLDTFDHYATARLLEKWTSLQTALTFAPAISTGNGRYGTQSVRWSTNSSNGSGQTLIISQTFATDTLIAGFAFRTTGFNVSTNATSVSLGIGHNQSGANGCAVIAHVLGSGGVVHVAIVLMTDGSLRAYLGDGTLLASSTGTLASNAYGYLQIKVRVHNSLGTVEVQYNGTTILTFGPGDTANGASALASLGIGHIGASNNAALSWDYDDLVLMDSDGASYNDFAGDLHGVYVPASAAGFYQDGVPVTDPTLVECVDEILADGDTSYFTQATATERASFSVAASWPGAGVLGPIQIVSEQRKDGGGAAESTLFARYDDTNYDGAVQGLGDTYGIRRQIYPENPNTTAPWEPGDPPEIGTLKAT